MSSLITKLNKRRSAASQKPQTPKTRKAAAKKQPRKKPTVVAKSKKVNLTHETKRGGSAKLVKLAKPKVAKKSSAKSAVREKTVSGRAAKPAKGKAPATRHSRAASPKTARKVRGKQSIRRHGIERGSHRPKLTVRVEQEVKKPPSPKTMAGIRAFELALKSFNRQDFLAAKTSFELILNQFSDQPDIVSPVRTYLAICDQKLAKSTAPVRGVEPLYNQGVFEFNRGNTQAAITVFEKALKLEPRADHVLYSLATAYAKAGNTGKALESLRRAIALSPVHRSHSRHDPDFAMLRDNPDFQRLSGLDLEFS
ncbi:MAG TPA: tetratricopeptide repeat protein [Blastocatellia bacterium]|nr:tetratricopeptide repeat protein [Blastocatellia bacterium]